ncbi:Craniofacial development protein 2 [Varanus komodoensis]|nr:Craniofacial development protein 2 [Varanus komodoensis]
MGLVRGGLLDYVTTTLLFSDRNVNSNLISWNRVVLLHGPPGTGKTSLCKALAQKLTIRLSQSTKGQKDMMLEDELLRLEGAQYATGEEQRASTSSTRKNEATGSKPKGQSIADVSGGERKVRCCKDLYSIGTWNVRSMNQGKLDVVKQEMTRLSIDILGISELKWTGMGEFNSDDHQVYYCGQSLRRNGVAFIVNKRAGKAVLAYNLQNDRMISVRIQGKPFNITVVQIYAPTTGVEEAEVDWFYEGLQHLLKLTPKNDVLIIMRDWNAKVGSQKIIGITGKFGLGVQNEAGHRMVEFCQENPMVIANTFFQQPNRRLYTWTSPVNTEIRLTMCSAAKDGEARYSQ